MKIKNTHYRTIWLNPDNEEVINIIDQRFLPHQFIIEELKTVEECIVAIKDMHVRGAGLIGATAGYAMYLATIEASKADSFEIHLTKLAHLLKASRPTAVNLAFAVNKQIEAIKMGNTIVDKITIAKQTAIAIADEDADFCKRIGEHGVKIIEDIQKNKPNQTIHILTHCNAGWLAFVDYGSALAPIYAAFEKGIDIHVWVDETRPRCQGAFLTAWELLNHGVPHTVIADNTGGHLMQHSLVDMVITGADRVTRCGDAANKIGTYLKALAAQDNHIPFYIALPSSTFDWTICDGVKEIPIEKRDANEVKYMQGLCDGALKEILITPIGSHAENYGFDVTPARLITSLITERGVCEANEHAILKLFPERAINK